MPNDIENTPENQGDESRNQLPIIQWVEKFVPLSKLVPFERNPRTITEAQFLKLKQSLIQDGYHSRIKCTQDFRVVGGHQRLKAMREIAKDFALPLGEIAVLIPDRALDDDTFRRIVIRDNHNNGVFDMEMLSTDYDLEELRDFGLHEVMNIPPMTDEGAEQPGKTMVKCPQCSHEFTTKGNKVG